jgi:hypothetical protein
LIPDFDENGYLPPGVHLATIEEVEQRFGHGSEEREAGMQSVLWLVSICRQAGIARLILNGSFVTNASDPKDVDCVLVPGQSFDEGSDAGKALTAGLPYLSIEIVRTRQAFDFFLYDLFATDRVGRAKGLVEVPL